MSQLFTSGGQRIGVSASASVLPVNIQGLISFRMGWLDLLAAQGTLKSLSQAYSSEASILQIIKKGACERIDAFCLIAMQVRHYYIMIDVCVCSYV